MVGRAGPRRVAAAKSRAARAWPRDVAGTVAACAATDRGLAAARVGGLAALQRARTSDRRRSTLVLLPRELALWEGSDFGEGLSYLFPGTPCQRVEAGHVCATTARQQARFPEDRWLVDIRAESYVGVPMRDVAGRVLGHVAVPPSDRSVAPGALTLAEKERDHILAVLEATGWVIEGPDGAARLLGIHASTLRSRLKRPA